MAVNVAQIVTKLKLDSTQFKGNVQAAAKSVLKLSAAGAAVTAAMGAAAVVTANFQDDMIKASRVAGTTAEKMSGIALAAEQSGVDMDTMRDALAKFQEAGPQEQLKKLGVAITDTSGNARDSVDIFSDFSDKIKALDTNAERTRLSMSVLGGEGARLATVLSKGSRGLEEYAEKAAEMGLVVTEKAGLAAEKFNDNLNNVSKSLKGVTDSLGSAVIEMVNASGIMETVTDVIIDLRQWFEGLDEDTKEIVITAATLAAGLTTLLGVFAGLVLIAPTVGAAFTIMMGPIGVITVGIGLLITGVVALVTHLNKAEREAKKFREEIAKKQELNARAAAIQKIVTSEQNLLSSVKDINNESKKLLTTNRFLTLEARNQRTLAISLLNIDKQKNQEAKLLAVNMEIEKTARAVNLFAAGIASKERLKLFAEERLQRAKTAKQRRAQLRIIGKLEKEIIKFKGFQTDKTKELELLMIKMQQVTWGITVPMGIIAGAGKEAAVTWNDVKKELEAFAKILGDIKFGPFETGLDSLIQAFDEATTAAEKIIIGANIVGLFARQAQQVVQVFSNLAEIASAGAQRALDILNRDFEVTQRIMEERQQEEIDQFEESRDKKLESMQDAFDAEIEALRKTEDEKLFIIEQGANLRLLVLDDEFQKEKELAEEKFQFFLEEQERKFDADKEEILKRAADEEQRKVNEQLLDEDFKQLTENLQAQHQENLSDLEKKFLDDSQDSRDTANEAKETETALTNEKIEGLEKQRDDALLQAQKAFADSFISLQETQAEEQRAIEKKNLEDNWKSQKQQYEQTKTIRKVEIGVSAAAAAAIVVAEMTAAFGPPGVAIGAALAASILGVAAKRIDQIDELKPIKPAGLLARGGVLSGPAHAGGGIPLEAEGGEAFIDKFRTADFLEKFDSARNMQRSIIINFEEGAIIMTGIEQDFTEDFLDNLGDALAERMEREGVLSPLS